MLTVVTGAYGLVGANLVRALLERGDQVRAADKRQTEALKGLDVEHVPIDVLQPKSLERAFVDADIVFHLAAIISIVGDPTGIVHRVNVEGPRNAALAALACGVSRFIHCSSVHAFDLERCGPELTETGPRATAAHAPAYDRSKNEGENEIRAAIARGRTGENYLLSGHRHSLKELAQLASQVTGAKVPRISMPLSRIKALAPLVLKLTPSDKIPLFTPDSLHALQYSPSVCHYKASNELGYLPRPFIETIRDTYAWFDSNEARTSAAAE